MNLRYGILSIAAVLAVSSTLIIENRSYAAAKRVTQNASDIRIADYAVANDSAVQLIQPPFEKLDPIMKDALNQLEMAFRNVRGLNVNPKIEDIRPARHGMETHSTATSDFFKHRLLKAPIRIELSSTPFYVATKNGLSSTFSSYYDPIEDTIKWTVQPERQTGRELELRLQIAFSIIRRLYGYSFPTSNNKVWYDHLAFKLDPSVNAKLELDSDVVFFKTMSKILAFKNPTPFYYLEDNERDATRDTLLFAPRFTQILKSPDNRLNSIIYDSGLYHVFSPDLQRSRIFKNEYYALEAMEALLEKWTHTDKGNEISYDMDLFDDLLEKAPRNFQELADIIRVVRPESGDLGKEWYTRYFEYDDVGEKTYSETYVGYDKPCRIAPSFDPIVAFENRKVKEGKY